MEAHIACIVQACERLRIDFRYADKNRNYVIIEGQLHFQLNKTPFNSESMAGLCKDKEHQYELLHDLVRMPKTSGFLDNDVPEAYRRYVTHDSIESIVRSVEDDFALPVVVKRNKGALGDNVFLCRTSEEVRSAIQSIFNKNSSQYDYVALAQAYIRPEREIRVVCFDGEPVLSYERYGASRDFGVKYWETEGGKAVDLGAGDIGSTVSREFRPALELPGLKFVALDVIIDQVGDWYLIELNSAPQFNHFIRQNGMDSVVSMYERMLTKALETCGPSSG
ncbi:MAG: hypothetical protein U9R74_11490 [Pseudomonadota bacterium]|nr:hypothetical protein [Pseudomonadota bacterium]